MSCNIPDYNMKCIICKDNSFRKIPLIHEISRYTKEKYPLLKCETCGLIRPNPLPYSDKNKLEIYDEEANIKFYDKEKKEIDRTTKEYNYYFKHFKPYIEFVRKYQIKGKSLDIGCGAGHLLEMLSKKGFNAEGMEITKKLVESLKPRFKIYHCEITDKKMGARKYDLITANQVLEHVENPEEFVASLNKILKEGGYAILAVPYISGIVPQILRSKWYGLGYGQHLNFFSKESLRILFERNGFEILEFKVLIVDYAHPKFPRAVNIVADTISSGIVSIGLGDNLFIVARKVRSVGK